MKVATSALFLLLAPVIVAYRSPSRSRNGLGGEVSQKDGEENRNLVYGQVCIENEEPCINHYGGHGGYFFGNGECCDSAADGSDFKCTPDSSMPYFVATCRPKEETDDLISDKNKIKSIKQYVCEDLERCLDDLYERITKILAENPLKTDYGTNELLDFVCRDDPTNNDPGLYQISEFSRFHFNEKCTEAVLAKCEVESF